MERPRHRMFFEAVRVLEIVDKINDNIGIKQEDLADNLNAGDQV